MPGTSESSTVEWQSAQVTPTLVSVPASLTMPLTPTTALAPRRSSVTAGLVGSTCPAFSAATVLASSASRSTFKPTESAVFGSSFATASCIRSAPVQSCSSPKVS